jgi:predicted PurR-regulated permease PerM
MNEKWSLPTRYFVIGILIALSLIFLFYIRDLLRPLIAAAFIAYLLSPVVAYLAHKTKWSRKLAGNVVYFTALALMLGAIASFIPLAVNQAKPIGDAFTMVVNQVEPYLDTPIVVGPITVSFEMVIPTLQKIIASTGTPALENALQLVEKTSRNGVYILLAFVVTYYFMTDWSDIRDWAISLAPEKSRNDARQLYMRIRSVWLNYLRGQIVLMFIVGVVFTIIYLIIGLPGAIFIGVLTGLLTLVPDVGPFIGTTLAVIVALLEGSKVLPVSNLVFALIVAAVYGVLIAIKNVWLRPFIMGRSVKMHEGLVFVAILGAVIYEGILGALIVIPVIASLAVIGRYTLSKLQGLPPFPEHDGEHLTTDEFIPSITRMHPKFKSKIESTDKESK